MVTDLDWIAMTVWGEARGESQEGKLAVAYVIVNRMAQEKRTACGVVLRPFQFSFWNTNDPSRWKMQPSLSDPIWVDCYEAARNALEKTKPDPTEGCTSYLNPDACTKKQQANAGYHPQRVRHVIGRHHFFVAA